MAEKYNDAKAFIFNYECDDCGCNIIYNDGAILDSNPPKYQHSCHTCKREYFFNICYPHIDYKIKE